MTCGSDLRWVSETDGLEGIGIDSGMLAFVDADVVDRFLDDCRAWYDGSMPPLSVDGKSTADGILLGTGGDGILPCAAEICNVHAHTFWIELDGPGDNNSVWQLVGHVAVPSGRLLAGDPGTLEEYAPSAAQGPIAAYGVWTELAVPSTRVDVHVLRDPERSDVRNLVIRVTAAQ